MQWLWMEPMSFGFIELGLFMIVMIMALDVIHGGIDSDKDGWL